MPKVLKTAVPGILVCLVTVALCAQDSSRKRDGDRVLKFPSDRSIGTVYIREPVAEQFGAWNEHDGWERLADAQGELQVSAGHQVRLDVGTVAARDLSPLDELRPDDLVTLRLGNSEVTDDELKHVGRLTGLVDLRLESTRVTDAGIEHLSELTSLRNLDCEAFSVHRDGHGISDESAETLSWLPNLQSIDLRLTKYTDRGLAVLARLPKLRSLELSGTKVTDAGLKALRGKATLRSLSLGLGRFEHCEITDEAMDDVATLTGLRWLRLNGTELTDAGLKQLSGLSDLNYLSVDDTSVTVDGVRPFAELPRLEYLRIPFSCGDQEAHVLATFPALKRIIADFDSIGDDGVVALTNAPTLEWLDLMSPGVTERGFQAIGRMSRLKYLYLYLYEARISDQALRPLGNLPNLELLILDLPMINGPGLQYLGRAPSLKELRIRFDFDDYGNPAERDPQPPVDLSSLTAVQNIETLRIGGDRLQADSLNGALQLTRLKSLYVESRLNARNIAELSGATALTKLTLEEPSEITDEGLNQIARLKNLEHLICSGVFTNAGLEHVTQLKKLTFLSLGSPFITDAGLDEMKRQLPGVSLFYRQRIGDDEQTLTLIRNQSLWPDDGDTVQTELGRAGLTLNMDDKFFRMESAATRNERGLDAMEGQPAPPIFADRWVNLDGEEFSPESLQGKLTVFHFWASWHEEANRRDMARLKKLLQRYQRFGVRVVSVHVAHRQDTVEPFVKAQGVTWPVAIDASNDQTFETWKAGFASLYLAGPDGNLAAAALHPMDLERAVQRYVLKQRR